MKSGFYPRPESATFGSPQWDSDSVRLSEREHMRMVLFPCSEQKNCAISHPLLNEETCIREYSTIRPSYNGH